MAQRKNPELDAKHQAILKKMMQIPENKTCADCNGPSPRWASTNLGVFLCISCSGIHRKLGTHISQVRSVTLDTWTPAQIAHFTKYGNARAAQYFEACIPPNFQRPPHGDSMQMERFIRDKYENKRYITVENGGLAGGSTEPSYHQHAGSSYSGGLGPRPSQGKAPFSYQLARKTGSSYNSYGGRFGSGSSMSRGGTSGTSQTRRTGGITGSAISVQGSRPINAIQRASTMKELINMGFSAQHAARAVEAAKGDLQVAVDWVLEHKDQGNVSNVSSFASSRQQPPQRDLLDFDDPAPMQQLNVGPSAPSLTRPKIMDTEVLMSTTPKTTVASKGDELADFADFGAFESALPATKPHPSEANSAATNGSLSSTIRNIYKQSPPQRAQPYVNGIPHIPRLDQSKQAALPHSPIRTAPSPKLMTQKAALPQSPIRTVPSPKLMAQKAAEANKKNRELDLGLTSFMGLAQSQYKFSSTTTAAQPSHRPSFHGVTSVKPNGGEALSPPPPPEIGVSASKSVQDPCPPTPPPPDSPLPTGEKPTEQVNPSTAKPEYINDPTLNNQNREQDDGTTTSSVAQPTTDEEAEEEDPFAALSMMAMKSAKSKTKKKNPAPHVILQNADMQNPATAQKTNGIDLDELLG